MNTRVVLILRGCPFCHEAVKAINYINLRLPDLKQIEVKDNFEWEEFGFKSHPIADNLGENFDGYPYIWIDGIEVNPGPKDWLIVVIARLVEEDLTTPVQIGDLIIG